MELLDTILAIINGKLPSKYEAAIVGDNVWICIRGHTHKVNGLIGWFYLGQTELKTVGCYPVECVLDLTDPKNTVERIEGFIRRMITAMTVPRDLGYIK